MMNEILNFVKYISIIQLMVIPCLVLFLFLIQVVLKNNASRLSKTKEKITNELHLIVSNNVKLSDAWTTLFKRNIAILLECLLAFEKECSKDLKWLILKKQIINNVLKPRARVLASSRRWLNKYLAVQCYAYGIDSKDERFLLQLIQHKILLVSLGAAQVIFKYPTTKSVDVLIDAISDNRRLNHSFFIEILTTVTNEEKAVLARFFMNRLHREKDPYVKSFCYRMATHLPASRMLFNLIKQDLLSTNIELKLSAITYLSILPAKLSTEILISLLNDEQFEVRAVVVKLLGEGHHEAAIPLLEAKLRDDAWWVRINAANALLKFGQAGITVLQRQTIEKDRFAYETAQRVLISEAKDY